MNILYSARQLLLAGAIKQITVEIVPARVNQMTSPAVVTEVLDILEKSGYLCRTYSFTWDYLKWGKDEGFANGLTNSSYLNKNHLEYEILRVLMMPKSKLKYRGSPEGI